MNLSERQWQLVQLVGGQRLSYRAAAEEMGGISVHTVQEYAVQVRDRVGLSTLRPRDALFVVWLEGQGMLPSTP